MFLDGVGDLLGEAFLDLQAPCEQFDQTNHFTQANHLAGRQVAYMALSEEGQEVVLAQRIHLDVFDQHHVAERFLE